MPVDKGKEEVMSVLLVYLRRESGIWLCMREKGGVLVELAWILQLRENWEIVSFFDKIVIKMQ